MWTRGEPVGIGGDELAKMRQQTVMVGVVAGYLQLIKGCGYRQIKLRSGEIAFPSTDLK